MLALTALSVGSLGSCILTHKPSLSLPLLASPNTIVKPCNGSTWKLRTPIKTVVAAIDSSQLAEKEQLFERLRLYGEHNKEQDFWLMIEPKFLDKFPNITKSLKRPAVALVSTNGSWITFMKLRLHRVLQENYEADSLEEALACTLVSLEFEKPEKWVAPYPKYESGWWKPFLPPGSKV
ncbi:hypothetical protein RND71_005628 [Anisodus tanguticus]|uniref:Uncharacterized protein n=1 Tax=Anisodus tanguticus TaxID=243964 RepID=A0AAE1VSJ2_9SOLA|nr:hypothetical protein RND71_005628 [Anisodus tanguticus]